MIRSELVLLLIDQFVEQLLHLIASHKASAFLLDSKSAGQVVIPSLLRCLSLFRCKFRLCRHVIEQILDALSLFLDHDVLWHLVFQHSMELISIFFSAHGLLLELVNLVEP